MMTCRNGLACAAALLMWGAVGAVAQTPPPATQQVTAPAPSPTPSPTPSPSPSTLPAPTAQQEAVAITPMPAPKTPEEASKVAERIELRLSELPAVEVGADATNGEKRLANAAKAFQETLLAAKQALSAFNESQATASSLGSADSIAAHNDQIEEYRKRVAEIQAANTRRLRYYAEGYIRDQLAKITEEHERIRSLADTTNKQQTNRQKTLAQFGDRSREATAALSEARVELDKALKAPTTQPVEMDAATAERVRTLNLRRLAWRVFLADLQVQQIAVEKVVVNLEAASAESLLPALQDYVRTLGDYRARLEKLAAQSLTEQIDRNLAEAETPYEKAYWQYRQLLAKYQVLFNKKLDTLRDRFPEAERQDLERDIDRTRLVYERLRERLERMTGPEKAEAFRQLKDQIAEYTTRKEVIAAKLDAVQRERDALLNLAQNEATAEVEAARQNMKTAIEAIEDPDVRKEFDRLAAEIASEYRPKLEAVGIQVFSGLRELIERLAEAEKEIGTLITELLEHRDNLFWSYTLARGKNLLQTLHAAVKGVRYPDLADRLLVSGHKSVKEIVEQDAMAIGLAGFALLLGLGAGLAGRFRLLHAAAHREVTVTEEIQDKEGAEVRFTDRFRIQTSRMAASVLPLGLPAALLLVVLRLNDSLVGESRLLVVRLLWVLLLAVAIRAIIIRLFRIGRPRFRMIQCSNVVAQHYRFWSYVVWWLSVLCIPPVVILNTLDLARPLTDAIWNVYGTLGLLAVLLFARRRQTVVRIVGRTFVQRRPLAFGFVARIYPLVFLVLVILLIMELIGFGALVDFIVRSLMHTFAALILASILADLISDFVARHVNKDPEEAATQQDPAKPAELSIDDLMRSVESRELGLFIHTLATFARWIVWIGALVWVFAAWGMSRLRVEQILAFSLSAADSENPVTVGRLIAAVIAIIAAFKVSKAVRTALVEKVYPTAYGGVNRAVQATINTLLHYTLVVLGIYIALRLVHVNLGAIAVLLGGLGLGLGLGLQPLVVNFVSGLIIFAERHVKVGDIVDVNGDLGEVVGISMRSTQVKSFDNIDMIIPNSEFVAAKVTNWTLNDTKMRGKLNVGVAYGSDVHRVRDVLLEIANKEPRVLAYPEPAVWFVDFGPSSLDFTVACWFPTPGDRWLGLIDIRYEIDRRFKEEGINIPFPQRTLSIEPNTQIPIRLVTSAAEDLKEPGKPTDSESSGDAKSDDSAI